MREKLIILLGLIIYCIPSFGQRTVNDIRFESWFGYELNNKSETVYCLLGTGYFRAPRADNTDSLISTWITRHSTALVVPVYTSGPTMTVSKESRMTYAWVIDKSDTLNIFLVRQGCVPSGTMQRPETWREMNRKNRKLYYENKKPLETVHIDQKTYNDFLNKVINAESDANKRKLGIWADKQN